MNTQISIIIPVLNEEAHIGALLEHLAASALHKNACEIIVVDGGSNDKTREVVKTFSSFEKAKISLLESEKGRAKQMNFGAKNASNSILYFLHADSFPPNHFDECIINEVKKGHKAGCFRMQFDSKHWWLQLAGWLTKFNWRACRGGDQSLFISKDLFDAIGGFDENYKIYEDHIMINALYKKNEFVVIHKTLKTSARMYQKHGVWKLQYFYWSIYIKRWFGANAQDLHEYYQKYVNVKM
ncbi:TIGR04283 family arsenosugar biosynthesis glycosyltransferase [Tamlana sp. I1]|uniref:TIGR04283 family arsenosugar biosynthesis glycosyltransferase n=1 Tax=Tamlana sp. I1 TaxID=2762061 RepID=UPI00188EC872|nr:TIGR04283 family arsenosugar biosynthesis glycosyltransferase [Tamlana sp. I1]